MRYYQLFRHWRQQTRRRVLLLFTKSRRPAEGSFGKSSRVSIKKLRWASETILGSVFSRAPKGNALARSPLSLSLSLALYSRLWVYSYFLPPRRPPFFGSSSRFSFIYSRVRVFLKRVLFDEQNVAENPPQLYSRLVQFIPWS